MGCAVPSICPTNAIYSVVAQHGKDVRRELSARALAHLWVFGAWDA